MKGSLEFHANGKLLITGEYLVLAGARALALPVRFGQNLRVEETEHAVVEWESFTPAGKWFTGQFDPETFGVISVENIEIADKLKKVLSAARSLNPDFLTGACGYKVHIRANYPLEWGLGSSSSLCYLVAAWAGVDAYDLHALVSRGSGYDIACAGMSELLYFRLCEGKPAVTPAFAGKALREYAFFAYLGNKQDTEREVASFMTNVSYTDKDVEQVSRLASLICEAGTYDELFRLVEEHESVLSTLLKREPIARRFPAFPGTAKSLGAWGGDFAMFVCEKEPGEVINILHRQGFHSVFTYGDIKAAS